MKKAINKRVSDMPSASPITFNIVKNLFFERLRTATLKKILNIGCIVWVSSHNDVPRLHFAASCTLLWVLVDDVLRLCHSANGLNFIELHAAQAFLVCVNVQDMYGFDTVATSSQI